MPPDRPYRTRFAPSPTGLLHLGHAFSALTGWARAQEMDGTFLLRIEDIDTPRCTQAFRDAIFDDLHWLGLVWPTPVIEQSQRRMDYDRALSGLIARGLVYPCRCTRTEIRAALSAPQEGAPAPTAPYPGTCRHRPPSDAGPKDGWRLNLDAALESLGDTTMVFFENGPLYPGWHNVTSLALLRAHGDIILARRDIGISYALAVVLDDAAQGITEVVRGEDLFDATPPQILLQNLLELPTPTYWHHALIRDEFGKRLAKRDGVRALQAVRGEGLRPSDILAQLGF